MTTSAVLVALVLVGCSPSAPTVEPDHRLVILTAASPAPIPSGAGRGCRLARMGPVRLGYRDDMLVILGMNGQDGGLGVQWPHDFTAWVVGGVAELRDPTGRVVAREGDIVDLGGGIGATGTEFHVCSVDGFDYP